MDNRSWVRSAGKTYTELIPTILAAAAGGGGGLPQNNVKIGSRMPSQIGVIYGISLNLGGLDPDGNPNIVAGNDLNLYLTLKKGSDLFMDSFRIDKMVFDAQASVKYIPLAIPGAIDLDKSFIANPAGLLGPTVSFDFWYIPIDTPGYMNAMNVIHKGEMNWYAGERGG